MIVERTLTLTESQLKELQILPMLRLIQMIIADMCESCPSRDPEPVDDIFHGHPRGPLVEQLVNVRDVINKALERFNTELSRS